MTASPAPSPPPHSRGPRRPRATLVPLGDTPTGSARDQWYLGGNGTMAHRPGSGSGLALMPPQIPRGLAPERSACGVFLTQVPAGPDIARCPVCVSMEDRME